MDEKILKEIAIVIPSLNPNHRLKKYIEELIEIGFKNIVIVNDGSMEDCDSIFSDLGIKSQCTILKHDKNMGKGRALKTAFQFCVKSLEINGIVTADADGQHSAKDTYKVAKSLYDENEFILGTRNFNEPQVPFKSRYGNKLTTLIFRLLYGLKVNDTQTGLRGIPFNYISKIIKLDGEKFDYEINVLIFIVTNKLAMKEVAIETIYIDDNRETHFDSVKDSIKIYKIIFKQFFKFIVASLSSSALDILCFYIFLNYICINDSMSERILFATIIARGVSSLFNYFVNHKLVFKSTESINRTLLKYYVLCVVQMSSSALFVIMFEQITGQNPTVIKIIVDITLFFISYQLQNKFIFRRAKIC